MSRYNQSQRGTISLEQAEILSHQTFAGGQQILRLAAPECAARARAGHFVHLQCDPGLPLRRPLSIMRVSTDAGWIELLYNVVGNGTRLLAARKPGEQLSLLGPIGTPFQLHQEHPRPLLIGGGVGMPPMIFLAQELRDNSAFQPLALFGSEIEFPFTTTSAATQQPGIPHEVNASMPLLEEWGIPSRLTSQQPFAGCFQGFVTDLARHWLDSLDAQARMEVEIFACGPHPMLAAVATIAREYEVPCQVSLEEFMACGVGACAGCVVAVEDDSGTSMRRVCVDGPVFTAEQVFP